jgi:hypothetical protein
MHFHREKHLQPFHIVILTKAGHSSCLWHHSSRFSSNFICLVHPMYRCNSAVIYQYNRVISFYIVGTMQGLSLMDPSFYVSS